jgi:hypothetical protein
MGQDESGSGLIPVNLDMQLAPIRATDRDRMSSLKRWNSRRIGPAEQS